MSEMTNDQPVEGDELLPNDGVDTTLDHQTDDGQGGDEGEDEVEDFEFNGKTITVPKALKEELAKGLLLHKDYTHKTQELGEQRRAHEASLADFTKETERFTTYRTESIQLATVREQLEAFDKVDWAAAAQKDIEDGTQNVTLARIEMDRLKDQAAKLEQSMSKLSADAKADADKRSAAAMASCDAALTKEFPKWAEMKPQLQAFAKANGVTDAELATSADPRIWRLMHFAKIGLEFAQRDKAAKTTEAQQATRPATTVAGARTTTSADPTSRTAMSKSADEWAKQRNAELEKKRGRGPNRRG